MRGHMKHGSLALPGAPTKQPHKQWQRPAVYGQKQPADNKVASQGETAFGRGGRD